METRFLVKIKYIGTDFVGWQVQKNGKSVQSAVQDAIESIFHKRANVTGCSRTDSGVHANEYYFCFDMDTDMRWDKIILALNAKLCESISVTDVKIVDKDFHPRYSSLGKQYVYICYDGRSRDPFLKERAYFYKGKIDDKMLNDCAKQFIGKHDFKAFMANGSKIIDTNREIYDFKVIRQQNVVKFIVSGNGFLYNMVRIMVGTLLFVNSGKIKKDDIKNIILSKDRKLAGKTAPACGLYLNKVYYDRKEII